MVTLTGPGGTGKTRLGLQVGATLLHDFQDGVFFVSLASLADPILVPSAIAEALSVQEGAGKDLLATLTDHLKEKHLLLVLDNYEHLLEASAVVTQLLDGCRELHVLVTSRIPLHVSREHEHAVSPLSVPDPTQAMDVEALSRYESVALFIERAKAAKDSFTLTTDSASAVAEICSRLDGLPLAIELAAARIKVFPPPALLQRLSSRLTLLTGGAKDRPSRQQTLRNTIEWSHSLLLEQEQSLFARLSVFAGGCTFEAAEAVCDPDGGLDLLEGMTGLVDKSLLRQEGEEELRFAMLETIREYAAEKLLEGGASEGVRAAHGEYFFQLAEEAERGLVGPEQGKWLSRLDQELDNLRGALRWFLDHGASEQGLCLGTALFRFWYSRGYYSEGQRWLEEGVAGERVASELRAKALWSLGTFAEAQGDWARATQLLEEALGLFWELGDRRGVARALNMLGNMTYEQGRYERATSLFEESLRLARELGDRRQSGAALGNLGWVALEQGALARAKDRLEEALETDRAVGDVQNVAVTLNLLGEVAFHEGNFTEAEVQSRAGLAVARELGAKRWLVRCVANLGAVARKQGKLEQAHELVREGLVLARELGDQVSTLQLLGSMAALLVARGELERAAGLKGAETGLRERLSMPLPPVYQAESEETLTQARELLGGEGFTRAWEAGRTMSLDEAVTIALGEDRQVA
jgi:non-specific serine/threonine protein kinase